MVRMVTHGERLWRGLGLALLLGIVAVAGKFLLDHVGDVIWLLAQFALVCVGLTALTIGLWFLGWLTADLPRKINKLRGHEYPLEDIPAEELHAYVHSAGTGVSKGDPVRVKSMNCRTIYSSDRGDIVTNEDGYVYGVVTDPNDSHDCVKIRAFRGPKVRASDADTVEVIEADAEALPEQSA